MFAVLSITETQSLEKRRGIHILVRKHREAVSYKSRIHTSNSEFRSVDKRERILRAQSPILGWSKLCIPLCGLLRDQKVFFPDDCNMFNLHRHLYAAGLGIIGRQSEFPMRVKNFSTKSTHKSSLCAPLCPLFYYIIAINDAVSKQASVYFSSHCFKNNNQKRFSSINESAEQFLRLLIVLICGFTSPHFTR